MPVHMLKGHDIPPRTASPMTVGPLPCDLGTNGSDRSEGHPKVAGIENFSYFLTYTCNIRGGDVDLGFPILFFSIAALCVGSYETLRVPVNIQHLVQLFSLSLYFLSSKVTFSALPKRHLTSLHFTCPQWCNPKWR